MGSWRWIDTKNASFEAMNIDEQCLFLNSQVTLVLIDNHVSHGLFQANPMGLNSGRDVHHFNWSLIIFFWIQGSVQESR
jgi:hypothetical protein